MFSFFGKKETKTKVVDRVFISSAAKNKAILQFIQDDNNTIIVTWFDESYNSLNQLLKDNRLKAEIFMAREISAHHIQNRALLFYEHHPLIVKETELLEKLQLKEAIFYSSLDGPLFKHFGGDRISGMLERMGMAENEAIEHIMISQAIKNAQEKISKSVLIEHSATSQAEWFSKNLVK